MGIFSESQPIYAACGIATFPVEITRLDKGGTKKKPLVRNYERFGLKGSASLVRGGRYAHASAFGFMTNARNKVAILDVDTTDERVLADALGRHGRTPLIAQTASGNFHAFYRHNGEHTRIRPFKPLPIDLLGSGGARYVVGAPSTVEGRPYRIIEGGLDDVDRLPVMQGLSPSMYGSGDSPSPARVAQQPKGPFDEGLASIREGTRNITLLRYSMQMLSEFPNLKNDAVLAAALLHNRSFAPPLSDAEVIGIVNSACKYTAEDKNFFIKPRVDISHAEVDELMSENPDAFLLLAKLRRHNWAGDFIVANAMAKTMGGWSRQRFAAAKAELEHRGKIICLRRGNGVQGAPLYAWG